MASQSHLLTSHGGGLEELDFDPGGWIPASTLLRFTHCVPVLTRVPW